MRLPIPYIALGLIIILGFVVRSWNSNWDYGFHLHPDERAIILFTLPLQFPQSIQEFFSPLSPWNPHFFAYGSFPLYLLKIVSSLAGYVDIRFISYDGLPLIGRFLSALFDTATILCVFLLGRKLFSSSIGLLAAFFYATSVLPIQLSHFYAVDTILSFFIILLLLQLIRFYEQPSKTAAFRIGILFGLALATKTSALVLIVAIGVALIIDFLLIFMRSPHKPKQYFPHIPFFLRRLIIEGTIIVVSTIITFAIFEPYAFIDFQTFLTQTLQQSAMTKSAFTFPYTLQYVGKIPYVYELQNMILWGFGPVLGITTVLGGIVVIVALCRKKLPHLKKQIIILSFVIPYFLIVGNFAIGFMRYMLPLYPLLCIFGAYFIFYVYKRIQKRNLLIANVLLTLFFLGSVIWPFSFLHIYQSPPTRVSATNWILSYIPKGKTLAIEHWDDGLPLLRQGEYTIQTLELYNPDSEEKWERINQQLVTTDYIILASNRLYTPLQRLTNCVVLPPPYCYRETAQYYKELFEEKRGFTKIAEFSVHPTIPFTPIRINDSSADESFTVYDHPTVIIFKKI